MTRADPKKAARVAYVIGTFAGHPAVMGSMNALPHVEKCRRGCWRCRRGATACRGAAACLGDAIAYCLPPRGSPRHISAAYPPTRHISASYPPQAFLTWLNKETTAKEYDNMHTLIEAFILKSNKAFKAQGFPLEFANWFSVWSMVYTEPGRYHWMFQVS